MTIRQLFTRVRRAIFGRPLTHEEATAMRDAQQAVQRASGSAMTRSRASSVQNQTYWGG